MSILNPSRHFHVLYGENEVSSASYRYELRPSSSIAADNPLTQGDVVYIVNQGGAAKANRYTGALYAPGTASNESQVQASLLALYDKIQQEPATYLVIEGMSEQESGYKAQQVTAIKGAFVFETSLYTAGAYVPGSKVFIDAGRPKLWATGRPAWGTVISYDSTSGKLQVAKD